jgi:large subunit ribosomal protein L5
MIEKKLKNPTREIKIEKIVLSIGGTGEDLEKGVNLLQTLTQRKPSRIKTRRRIPSLNVRPGLEVGAVVTLRKNIGEVLNRMLATIDNKLKKKQISSNNFSFGIHEYIEIPGMEFIREIGIRGLDVTVVFKRAGRRVKLRKVKRGKFSQRQVTSKEEIIKFMEDKFNTKFIGR